MDVRAEAKMFEGRAPLGEKSKSIEFRDFRAPHAENSLEFRDVLGESSGTFRDFRPSTGGSSLEFRDLFAVLRAQQATHEHRVEELLKATSRGLEEALLRTIDLRLQRWCRNPKSSLPLDVMATRGASELSFPGVVEEETKVEDVEEIEQSIELDSPSVDSKKREHGHSTASKRMFMRHRSSTGSNQTAPTIHAQLENWRAQRKELLHRQDTVKHSVRQPPSSFMFIGRLGPACAELAKSRQFETVVATLIIGSAVSIGLQEDWQVRHVTESRTPEGYDIVGFCINVCFAVELTIRLFAEGLSFFWYENKNFNWNVFDTFLVLCSVIDEVVKRLELTETGALGAARLLRLMRLVRVVRIIRVLRLFRELRVMVSGIMSSAKPLVWAIVLLLIIIFIFSVSMLPFVRDEMALIAEGSSEAATTDVDGVVVSDWFGSLIASMSTLFLAISGGVDWGDVARPLSAISPYLGAAFAVYIAFATFCVLNIITGVFVETASRLSMMDEDLMVAEEIDTKLSWYEDVRELFDQANVNEDGAIDATEFCRISGKLRIQSRFRKLGVEVSPANAKAIFNLLDIDDSGSVDFEKFALGIQQFHGHAKGLDIARIRLDNKKLGRQIAGVSDTIAELFEQIGLERRQALCSTPSLTVVDTASENRRMSPRQVDCAAAPRIGC